MKIYQIVYCLLFFPCFLQAQDSLMLEKRSPNFVILPATAYTPETGFTLGAITEYYFDLANGDRATRMSKLSLVGIYTTKKQLYFNSSWNLFLPGERYILEGEIKYSSFTDRHYGIGNEISEKVYEFDLAENTLDSFSYLAYKYQFFYFRTGAQLRLKKHWYLGLQLEYDHAFNFETIAENPSYDSQEIIPASSMGKRAGLGWKLSYDNRKNINNPLKGSFVQLDNWYYLDWLGSDQNYQNLSLDARHYINTHKNQTLALRMVMSAGFEDVPYRGMMKVGGKDFIRGYFEGSYRDKHILAFQTEYRLPLWGDLDASFWKFWNRLGIVVFFSGSNVAPRFDEMDFQQFRLAAGGGLRVLFSKKQRVNLRIDYGIGLNKTASLNRRQTGLYFYLSEAF